METSAKIFSCTQSIELANIISQKFGIQLGKVNFSKYSDGEFQPSFEFSLWHDRATFHFLTEKEDIKKYIKLVEKAIKTDGFLIIATFSNRGPLKCSGLEITQYSEETLHRLFHDKFELINAFDDVHKTPFETEQNFIYTVFKRK